jgi:hypothetical protein
MIVIGDIVSLRERGKYQVSWCMSIKRMDVMFMVVNGTFLCVGCNWCLLGYCVRYRAADWWCLHGSCFVALVLLR